jgi:hypothetical protein
VAKKKDPPTVDELNQREDHDAEEVLKTFDIFYEYRIVALADIDVEQSRNNRGRLIPLDKEYVDLLTERIRDGDRMPALCLRDTLRPVTPYVIAGGNHRHAAFVHEKRTYVAALVFESTDHVFAAVTKRLNAIMGVIPDVQSRVAQAADLVSSHRFTVKEAAANCCVHVDTVHRYLRRLQTEAAILENGFSRRDVADIPATKMDHLNKLASVPTVMSKMAKLTINQPDLTAMEVRNKVDRVLKLPSESERLAFIEQEIASCKPEVKRVKRRGQRQVFLIALHTLETTIGKYPRAKTLRLEAAELAELTTRWRKLDDAITTMLTTG